MLTFTAADGQFWCSMESWTMLRRLAKARGWAPTDPLAVLGGPDDAPRELDPADDQLPTLPGGTVLAISDRDAHALAEALEAALPDIPGFDALDHRLLWRLDAPSMPQMRFIGDRKGLNPFEYFSGDNRPVLERFIRLCRSGGLNVR